MDIANLPREEGRALFEVAVTNLRRTTPSRKLRLKQALLHIVNMLPLGLVEKVYALKRRRGFTPATAQGATSLNVAASADTPLKVLNAPRGYSPQIARVSEHPFAVGDHVISMGLDWESKYLQAIEVVKRRLPLRTAYFVHDMIPLIEPHFYQPRVSELYRPFYYWACRSSDVVYFGGKTALADGRKLLGEFDFDALPQMDSLRLGAEFDAEGLMPLEGDAYKLEAMGVDRPYVLAVGTIQVRKNHEVLYRALLRWLDEWPEAKHAQIPLFVFAGKPGWLVEGLVAQMRNDERVATHLLMLQPDDAQLRVLYRNCKFTLLPSFYEGAALPISESLAYGKFCLAADVPPLRESGGEYLDYVDPRDVAGWKQAIAYYIENPSELAARERRIRAGNSYVSWAECADELVGKFFAPTMVKLEGAD